jgi:aerobic carbon-monoxide dehydrogenase large subunit
MLRTVNTLGVIVIPIPVGALFAQAIGDALGLPSKGVELLEIPLSPKRLWELVSKAG